MSAAIKNNKKNSRNIRNNPNLARRIPRTSSFTTRGYFPSRKNSASLYFESYLELWQLIEAEYAADIHYINTQPHTIKYINSKGNLAHLFHFSSQYFDVDERLFAALDVLPEQCAIAEATALLRQYKEWPAATFYCLFLQYYICDLERPLSPNSIITRNIF